MGIFNSRNKMNQDREVLIEYLQNSRQNNSNNKQTKNNGTPLTRDDFKFYMDALLGCLTQKGNLGAQCQDAMNLLDKPGSGQRRNVRPPGQDAAGPNLNQITQNQDIQRLINPLMNSTCFYFSPYSYNSYNLRTPFAV
jgi:hypothetical protein